MSLIKDLLSRISGNPKVEPATLRGLAPLQTDAEQSASRTRMEAEMAGQKERRDSARLAVETKAAEESQA